MSLDDVFLDVSGKLATVAPSYFGEKHLARNHDAPRYVWVPRSSSFASPVLIGRVPSDLSLRLNEDKCNFDVHIWAAGASDDEQTNDLQAFSAVVLMRDLLITALHDSLQRRSEPTNAEWKPFDDADRGLCLVLSMEISLTVLETYPAGALTTSLVQSVAFDTSTANSFDGTIQPGDP